MAISYFSEFMTEKKKTGRMTKSSAVKPTKSSKKSAKQSTKKAKPSKRSAKSKRSTKAKKRPSSDQFTDSGIVIVDNDMEIDQERVNEERRAYLEEARSQEAFD